MAERRVIAPTKYQRNVLTIPHEYSIALSGSKGGGKSYAIAFLILQHVHEYGGDASVLYIRRSHPELQDFIGITREVFKAAYPDAEFNVHTKIWTFPNGALVELGHYVSAERDLPRYWGRRRTMLALDECTDYASPKDLDPLLADLKPRPGVHARTVWAGNAGRIGSGWYARRFVISSEPWKPAHCKDLDLQFIQAPGSWRQNDHLDAKQFQRALNAAAGGDKAKLLAWSEGDFAAGMSGTFFDGVLSDANMLPNWSRVPGDFRGHVRPFISLDYGSSAPSVALLCASVRHPLLFDTVYFPRGSLIVLAEWTSATIDKPNEGSGETVTEQAHHIKEMCERFGVTPQGPADDACFARHHGHSAPSIAELFRQNGVFLVRANKGARVAGWERMRGMLKEAGSIERPWLGITQRCEYFWSTVPYLARDSKYVDDLKSEGQPDHSADAARYALTWGSRARASVSTFATNDQRLPSRAELEAELKNAIVV